MTISNANLRYLEASINSASPEELIIKVYDALLLFARQAIETMESRPSDIQGRHDLLRRAQRACALLMGSLRLDLDSEIPGNLFRIYEFWHHQLVAANMRGRPETGSRAPSARQRRCAKRGSRRSSDTDAGRPERRAMLVG